MKNLFPVIGSILLASATLFSSCQKNASANGDAHPEKRMSVAAKEPYKTDATWNNYWYQGKAELTSYHLTQSRYGELHEGTVVNIFVTEDFSKEKQVKLDNSSGAGNDKLSVLKLNQSIKFNTGIYPYSLMLSSFQPVDINNYPHAVKITGTMQEWCGMAFYQMNNRDNKYVIEQRSYFEQEGDHDTKIEQVVQEDELWNRIRISPATLPTGEIKILPGAMFLRLAHKPLEAVNGKLTLTEKNELMVYTIEMPSLNRKLTINFEKQFPYKITGWQDAYPGLDGKVLTTVAEKNKDLMLDYWRTHTNADRVLREQLGIPKDTQ